MKTDNELIEKNRFDMETIWSRSPKEENLPSHLKGEYVLYLSTDPKYLYLSGFVDVKQFSYEEWENAFQECKQPDGSYLISKDQFIILGKYKYSGPVKKPLDAMKIREGWYKLTDWHEFCANSILPSTSILKVEDLVQMEKIGKENGKIIGNRILIDKSDKLRIKQLLDEYPSPIRRRELGVAEAYEQLLKSESERSKIAIVKTTFKKGQKLGDKDKKALKETLLKSSQIIPSSENEETPTLSLKDLQKKSKSKPSV